jgi:hypothetical protein
MKQLALLFLVLFFSKNITSQTTIEQSKIDSLKKYKMIHMSGLDITTSTVYTSGANAGKTVGGTARSLIVDFKIGEVGSWKSVGKKGKNIYEIIKNDALALKEYENSRMHLRKKKLYNVLEWVSYPIGLGSAIPLSIGAENFEDEGVNGLLVGGIIGVVVGLTSIVIFKKLTDKEMDRWAESLVNAAQVYNENLVKNLK